MKRNDTDTATVQQQYNIAIVHTVFPDDREHWQLMVGVGSFAKTTVNMRAGAAKKLIEELGLTKTNAPVVGAKSRTMYS